MLREIPPTMRNCASARVTSRGKAALLAARACRHSIIPGGTRKRLIAAKVSAAALAILSVGALAGAKTKPEVYTLKAHPTKAQMLDFAVAFCNQSDLSRYDQFQNSQEQKILSGGSPGPYVSFWTFCADQHTNLSQSDVVAYSRSFLVDASIMIYRGSRSLDVLLSVKNGKDGPSIEVFPQKVFLADGEGLVHFAVPEYEAKATIAAQHRLPPFSPPPPETYYTITQVPISSEPAGPTQVYAIQDIGTGYLLYGTQPRITTYQNVISANQDWGPLLGYELGYLLRAWIDKREAKKQLKWIDENWFHHERLGPGELQVGYLMFESVLGEPLDPSAARPAGVASDSVNLVTSPMKAPLTLVIFVENQQFEFRFGPELVERKTH